VKIRADIRVPDIEIEKLGKVESPILHADADLREVDEFREGIDGDHPIATDVEFGDVGEVGHVGFDDSRVRAEGKHFEIGEVHERGTSDRVVVFEVEASEVCENRNGGVGDVRVIDKRKSVSRER